MRKLFYLVALFMCCSGLASAQQSDYFIDPDPTVPVPRHVIESYLSRSINIQSLVWPQWFHNGGRSLNLPPTTHDQTAFNNSPQIDRVRNLINQVNPTQEPMLITLAEGDWDQDNWYSNPDHWDHVEWLAEMAHSINDEIIIEAAMYEKVRMDDNLIVRLGDDPEEEYIFAEWGMHQDWPAGQNFIDIRADSMVYDEMIYARRNSGPNGEPTLNGTWYIPDITKFYTRVYWYWRACEYIRRGYESIHVGRMDLMAKHDCDNALLGDLLRRIKDFAISADGQGGTMAKRGHVFFNGQGGSDNSPEHIPGCVPFMSRPCQTPFVAGSCPNLDPYVWTWPEVYYHKNQVYYTGVIDNKEILWDWGSAVISLVEKNPPAPQGPNNIWPQTILSNINTLTEVKILRKDDPQYQAEAHWTSAPYGNSIGGIHPQGWLCDRLPYTVNWDNTHGGDSPIHYTQWNSTYNMDDKTWFLSLPNQADRENFINYAYPRVKCLDRNSFFVMPGAWHRRPVMDPTNFPNVPNTFPEYTQNVPINDERFWFATDVQSNLAGPISTMWTNSYNHSDRGARFMSANRRDGSVYHTFSWGEKIYTGDFNSDGLDDVLVTANNEPGVNIQWGGYNMYQTQEGGDDFDELGVITTTHPCAPTSGISYLSWGENFYVGDFDGDGFRNEIAVTSDGLLGIQCVPGVRIYRATFTVNGNGQNVFNGFQYTGLSLAYPSWDDRLYIGDFNGDGLDDILATAENRPPVNNSSYGNFRILYNTHNGTNYSFSAPVNFSYCNTGCTGWGEEFYIGDFDGDGADDFFVVADANTLSPPWLGLELYQSVVQGTTNTFLYQGNITCSPVQCYPSWGERYYVGDFDGDGRDDFFVTADMHQNIFAEGFRVFMSKSTSGNFVFQDKGLDGHNSSECAYPSWGEIYHVGDYNGDGNSDFIVIGDKQLSIDWDGWDMYWSRGGNGWWKPGKHNPENVTDSNMLTFEKTRNYIQGRQSENPVSEANYIYVYPNPVNDVLNVRISTAEEGTGYIRITTADGRVVSESDLNIQVGTTTKMIDISKLQTGVYIYQVKTNITQKTGKITKL